MADFKLIPATLSLRHPEAPRHPEPKAKDPLLPVILSLPVSLRLPVILRRSRRILSSPARMILAFMLLNSAPVIAAEKKVNESTWKIESGTVTFLATGKPGFLRINGQGAKPAGQFSMDKAKTRLTAGEVKVALDSFETGLSLRDRHMKEKYLETAKFPEAVFKADGLDFAGGKIPSSTDLKGSLTLHGVTKPVTANLKIEETSGDLDITAEFEAILSDYSIVIPEYAGVTVAEKVKISTTFKARPTTP